MCVSVSLACRCFIIGILRDPEGARAAREKVAAVLENIRATKQVINPLELLVANEDPEYERVRTKLQHQARGCPACCCF